MATTLARSLPAVSSRGPSRPVTARKTRITARTPAMPGHSRPALLRGVAGEASAAASSVADSRIRSPTSAMSRSRCRASLRRHRSSSRRVAAVVPGGSALQSGSRCRMVARTSVIVSPPKTARPVRSS